MKQKVVVRFGTKSSKSRSKALTIAVGVQGVLSVALKGQDKDEIEVVGEGMDSVVLATLLRKGVGFAELVSVEEKKEEEEKKKEEPPVVVSWPYSYTYGPPYYYTNWVLP